MSIKHEQHWRTAIPLKMDCQYITWLKIYNLHTHVNNPHYMMYDQPFLIEWILNALISNLMQNKTNNYNNTTDNHWNRHQTECSKGLLGLKWAKGRI